MKHIEAPIKFATLNDNIVRDYTLSGGNNTTTYIQ